MRRPGSHCPNTPALCAFFALVILLAALPLLASDSDSESDGGEHFTARMGGSLWDTLIDHGVDPTQWRYIFDYNRENNPAFSSITSSRRIPRGMTIYIPTEIDGDEKLRRRAPARPPSSTIEDTVEFFGDAPFLHVKAGRGESLSDIIRQFCMPAGIDDTRLAENMRRGIYSDIRDIYRRAGKHLRYRSREFFIPTYLTAASHDSLTAWLDSRVNSLTSFTPRDSVLDVSVDDIRHIAAPGERYTDLADRYLPTADQYPRAYAFHGDRETHLRYMAQQIRHYNLNQPLWPGKVYYIPSYLLGNRYYRDNPPVELTGSTSKKLVYGNGLEVSLSHHVTRRKTYYRRRLKHLPALERKLDNGAPVYPDMVLWHRTGLDPEVEQALRAKGRHQFSLNYIYRMAVTNYYIDDLGNCFLIVPPEKNPRDHAGNPVDYRCYWNGQNEISDVSIGIEIEAGFTSTITEAQLETSRKLQQVLRSMYIIPDERVLDHCKVAARRGPDMTLVRGRKADRLTVAQREAIGIAPVLDPDVIRGLVQPNLNEITTRQADSTDFWFNVKLDPDLVASARRAGWRLSGVEWTRAGGEHPPLEPLPSSFE